MTTPNQTLTPDPNAKITKLAIAKLSYFIGHIRRIINRALARARHARHFDG